VNQGGERKRITAEHAIIAYISHPYTLQLPHCAIDIMFAVIGGWSALATQGMSITLGYVDLMPAFEKTVAGG
jgi:hypothetical protein